MGFLSPDLPVVDVAEWRKSDRAERLRPMARHIAERGMGYPEVFYVLYAVKIGLYIVAGLGFALATKGIDGWGNIGAWWNEPIVFQKVVLWSLLFEVLGLGCGFGPLTGKVMPPLGSPLYWLRTGTVRLPPWPRRIPLTGGDRRTLSCFPGGRGRRRDGGGGDGAHGCYCLRNAALCEIGRGQ